MRTNVSIYGGLLPYPVSNEVIDRLIDDAIAPLLTINGTVLGGMLYMTLRHDPFASPPDWLVSLVYLTATEEFMELLHYPTGDEARAAFEEIHRDPIPIVTRMTM